MKSRSNELKIRSSSSSSIRSGKIFTVLDLSNVHHPIRVYKEYTDKLVFVIPFEAFTINQLFDYLKVQRSSNMVPRNFHRKYCI